MGDLAIVYYTANVISDYFAENVREQIRSAAPGVPIFSVSKEPIDFGMNGVVGSPRSHWNIYRQAWLGAKAATTSKYIALCEDDVLYSPEHFKYRPQPGKFAYNLGTWMLFTWSHPPTFSHKANGRINLNSLICERELFIEAMDERFEKYPDGEGVDIAKWAEPGKYEKQLGVTVHETEVFYTNPPNIVFSHDTELSYENLGPRKRLGEVRATEIPFWGSAKKVMEVFR